MSGIHYYSYALNPSCYICPNFPENCFYCKKMLQYCEIHCITHHCIDKNGKPSHIKCRPPNKNEKNNNQ